MLDAVAELLLDLGFDWFVDRDDDRTTAEQLCLFLGVVFALLAIALAALSGPSYGLATGIIAVALLVYGR
ncbi:hypothetical protein [Natrinema soli]|uniref:Uncharacterized protein n=1 Tax=Natrinema soli TaxID=1930624 RepID=A0ABD5SJQ0_9EURY|nr:hypothetical protein [Natrinema soli]